MSKAQKVDRKKIQVVDYGLETKRIANKKGKEIDSHYNKLQRIIANIFKLELAEKYQYLYRLHYKGTSLRHKDVLSSKHGILFMVVNEQNKRARIVTLDSYKDEPNFRSGLVLIEEARERELTKNKK